MSLNTQFTLETCRSTYFDAIAIFGSSEESYAQKLRKNGRITHFLREAYMHQKAVFLHGQAIDWAKSVGLPGEFSANVGTGSEIEVEQGVAFIPTAGLGVQLTQTVMGEMAKHRCWARETSHIAA